VHRVIGVGGEERREVSAMAPASASGKRGRGVGYVMGSRWVERDERCDGAASRERVEGQRVEIRRLGAHQHQHTYFMASPLGSVTVGKSRSDTFRRT
jgi:hypothetical protein